MAQWAVDATTAGGNADLKAEPRLSALDLILMSKSLLLKTLNFLFYCAY